MGEEGVVGIRHANFCKQVYMAEFGEFNEWGLFIFVFDKVLLKYICLLHINLIAIYFNVTYIRLNPIIKSTQAGKRGGSLAEGGWGWGVILRQKIWFWEYMYMFSCWHNKHSLLPNCMYEMSILKSFHTLKIDKYIYNIKEFLQVICQYNLV